jgi:hypothetical protein
MSGFNYTISALVAAIFIAWIVERLPPRDHASTKVTILNEDEFRTAILHQDLKLVAFFLAAITVMLGVVADQIQ